MKKIIPLFLKIPGALLLGLVAALSILQNDPWLKERIERLMISSVSSIVGELLTVKVSHIDLLKGEILLHDFSLSSSQKRWSYSCPEMRMHILWFSWQKGTGWNGTIDCEKPIIYTRYSQSGFAIADPLNALINAPVTLPLKLVKSSSRSAEITVESPTGELKARCGIMTLLEAQGAITKCICLTGSVLQSNKTILEHLAGTLEVEAGKQTPYAYTLKGSANRPGLPQLYHFYYESQGDLGSGLCRTEDGSITLLAQKMQQTPQGVAGDVTLTGDLTKVASLLLGEKRALHIAGKGIYTGNLAISDVGYRYEGGLELTNGLFGGVQIPFAQGTVVGDEKNVAIKLIETEGSDMALKGEIIGRIESGEVSAKLFFTGSPIKIPYTTLERGNSTLVYKDGALQAEFKADGTFFETEQVPLRGTLITDFSTVQVRATLAGNQLHLEADLDPLTLKKVTFKDSLHQKRLSLERHYIGQASAGLEGVIDGYFFKKLFQLATGYQITGTGEAQVKSSAIDGGTRVELLVRDASLKIPGSYTLVEGLAGTIELYPAQNSIVMNNLLIQFHKGSAWSSRALFCFTPEGTLLSAHLPIQCQDLLVSKQKDIFGTTSGGLTCSYRSGRWQCTGIMTIENAHMRSNVLSSKVQRTLMLPSNISTGVPDIELDIALQNKTPLKIETSFLSADAYLDLRITGSSLHPAIEGIIELSHGSFNFPYKPLLFSQGTVQLSTHQVDGPTIDLTAKNKIRSYTVTMRVTGTLDQPRVTFESVPSLSEEAIMTLLLAGSDDGSLSAAMPRLLMEQIEAAIFGSEEKLSAAQQFLKGIFTQLKKVRLVKKGAAQDEVQAVVEVDINDRLRAKAQNNLTLSDDTQLELEYAVSDDVTVKAVRDQEGSLGGEVEMRWKF